MLSYIQRKHVFSFLFMICMPLFSVAQVNNIGTRKVLMNLNGNILKIPYFSNSQLDILDHNVNQAIIVIHGTDRNADDYYANMLTAALMRPDETDSTIIVAPQFLTEADIDSFALDNEHLYWSSGGWKSGSNSKNNIKNPRPVQIPSYAVLDTILLKLAQNFPNLNSIVFTGHSAGGQLTNRYAASTPIVDILYNQYQVCTKFIVANPSSYLYMDNKRRISKSSDQFEIPTTSCDAYNEWKYGLDDLYTYPSQVGVDLIRSMLAKRQCIYLLGENDNNPNSTALDVTCMAMLQGSHRLERGSIYIQHLISFYGESILNNHSIDTVPDVGHSNFDMYTSDKGLYHLFESYPNFCGNVVSTYDYTPLVFSVYPNPTSGIVEIHSDHNRATITVHDIFGKLLKKIEYINGTDNHIDIGDLNDGIYLLGFNFEGSRITKRIIKCQ